MKELVLPVPETVSATYIVPVPSPVSTVEAKRLAREAVEARLTGPLRTLTAEWLAKGAVKVKVEAADTPASGLLDKPLFGTPEQQVFLTVRARSSTSAPRSAHRSLASRNGRHAARPRRWPSGSAHPCLTRRRSRY